MTDEYQIDGTTHAEKNSNGDIEHKPDVVNTVEAQIAKQAPDPDLVVSNVPDDGYVVIDGRTNEVLQEGTRVDEILQPALDNFGGSTVSIGFGNSRSGGYARTFIFDSAVTIPQESVSIVGKGRNKTQLEPDDNSDVEALFIGDADSGNGAIFETFFLKMVGNKSNNNSSTGVKITGYNEYNSYFCEFRTFADYAVHFDPSSDQNNGWNEFVGTWVLDNNGAGVYMDGTNNKLKEISFVGGFYQGSVGAPAIYSDDGANAIKISSQLKGSNPVKIDGGFNVNISGCLAKAVDGDYIIDLGDTNTTGGINIAANTLVAGNATNIINLNANTGQGIVDGNYLSGSSGETINRDISSDTSIGGDNKGFVTENSGVVGDGVALDTTNTQSITISHGLDIAPFGRGIDVSLTNPDATDFEVAFIATDSTTDTEADITVKLSTASSTTGAQANLGWRAERQT